MRFVLIDEKKADVKKIESLKSIQALAPARHIFSHVEWHMHAYVVLVEETTAPKENILFTEAQKAVENYAVPSAFSAYWNAIKMEIKE